MTETRHKCAASNSAIASRLQSTHLVGRVTDADDVRTGFLRTTYAGSVTARGATLAAAWGMAQAQAVSLGANKHPFLVSSQLTRNDKLFQTTGGVVFVTIEFSYEYQRKGARTYLEVTAERVTDTFGQTTETLSGFLAAPDLATADAAWTGGWDQLIVLGNDVVVYPDAINGLVAYAAAQPVDWIAGWEISPEMLIREHPDARRWFHGPAHVFTDFDQRPWEAHQARPDWTVNARRESLCFNSLLLFKRRVFEQLGYMDANFFPVYFSDNDYWFRLRQTDLRACALVVARHFHFGSRTIHQGVGGSSARNFENNRAYYLAKWGGNPGQEQWTTPFNGRPQAAHERYARALRITTRVEEAGLAESWRQNTRPE